MAGITSRAERASVVGVLLKMSSDFNQRVSFRCYNHHMTKNAFINALAATGYITLVALFMFYGTRFLGNKPDTIFAPIAMISLFTLSAAMMGFIFLYQPLQLYFEGEKKAATGLFLKTVGFFACLTAAVFLLLFIL